jgi:hypothetical protein
VYRNEEFMNLLTPQTALSLYQVFDAQQKRGGRAEETFQKDPPPPDQTLRCGSGQQIRSHPSSKVI